MEEEPERGRHPGAAQLAAQRHEVVVVHPDRIVAVEQRHQTLGEGLVDPAVGGEVRGIERGEVDPAVQQRPQRTVGEAEVVAVVLVGAEVDGGQRKAVEGAHLGPATGALDDATAPAEPQAAVVLERRHHPGGEPTRAGARVRGGDAIRDHDQA